MEGREKEIQDMLRNEGDVKMQDRPEEERIKHHERKKAVELA
jgi:hypothetical protein